VRVTIHIADIASYQGGLTLAQLKAAGFTGVNFKVSHGLTLKSVHPDLWKLAEQALAEGWKVSTFHYLTDDASGDEQARFAFSQMVRWNLASPGCVHVVDVEDTKDPPTAQTWRDYCARMASFTGRETVTYTGRWWWMRYAKDWPASPFSPWLWAAPGAGYLDTYPGDDSPHWDAGYGQWPQLAAMQYRVAPVAGIPVSQTAVRSEDAWRAMGGIDVAINSVPASTALVDEFNALAPKRSKASDGTVGDVAHSQSASDHNYDETGNTGGAEDSDALNEVHARDVTAAGPWPAGWSMERSVQLILARCRAGAEKRIRYIIYNRRIWRRSAGWVQESYTGSNPHDKHAHFSFMYGSGSSTDNPENITTPYGLLAELRREQEEDMGLSAEDRAWLLKTVRVEAKNAVVDVLRDGSAASLGQASGDNATDRGKRNIRDFLRTIVGGPTEDDVARAEQSILAELRKTHPDEPTEPATPPVS
jgi:hypothetical protein